MQYSNLLENKTSTILNTRPYLQIALWLYAGPSVTDKAWPTWVWVRPRPSRRSLKAFANSLMSSKLMPSTTLLDDWLIVGWSVGQNGFVMNEEKNEIELSVTLSFKFLALFPLRRFSGVWDWNNPYFQWLFVLWVKQLESKCWHYGSVFTSALTRTMASISVINITFYTSVVYDKTFIATMLEIMLLKTVVHFWGKADILNK